MSKVAVILRVLPEDISVSLEQLVAELKKKLPSQYSLEAWDEEPIAFGLKALRLLVLIPESTEGGTEPLEELIGQLPGVSQVEVLVVHRAF
ncbi:MAG: elongation factor 1-beta [Desulfurococcaceae archaeon]